VTDPQNLAARRVYNPRRASVKLQTVRNEDGSETFTPYLVSDPAITGTPVTITRETSLSEVTRLFTASLRTIPE
jgi:hypothetical protein